MDAHDIIKRPILTERSMDVLSSNKYTFEVAPVSKVEIARAVEELFGVKVIKVNTMNVRGKKRRRGRQIGYTSSWKKAIVTLAPGSKKIEFFEGLT